MAMGDPAAQAPNPALAEFIGAEFGRADRLMRAHVEDRTGRCQGCPIGAHGHLQWPCQIQLAAAYVRAREVRAGLRWKRP